MFWSTAGIGKYIFDNSLAINSLSSVSTLPVLQDATFFCSLGWILYRIWQIYQKPVDELVDLLGLDIPPVPDVSLGGISSDSVLLYWKPVDNQSTSLKHAIQVNGIKGGSRVNDNSKPPRELTTVSVGEINLKDDSIQVTGLKPGHFYNIRVIATNLAGFSTLGSLIRLRTVPAVNKYSSDTTRFGEDDGIERVEDCEPASIRPVPSHSGLISHAPPYQTAKEAPSTQHGGRRTLFGRRASPATSVTGSSSVLPSRPASVNEDDSDSSIQRLTEHLDRLRREQYETDKQIDDEDREHLTAIADLSKDRDRLKQMLKEKEESAAELKKHSGQLEKTNRSAQSRKAMKERILHQKKAERQKVLTDIDHWDGDIASMRQESQRMALEAEQMTVAKGEHVAGVRTRISEDQGEIKILEDDIRTMGTQIKLMEKGREGSEGHEDDEQDGSHKEASEDKAWDFRAHTIQMQLANMWQTLQQVKPCHSVQDNLELMRSRLKLRTSRHKNV